MSCRKYYYQLIINCKTLRRVTQRTLDLHGDEKTIASFHFEVNYHLKILNISIVVMSAFIRAFWATTNITFLLRQKLIKRYKNSFLVHKNLHSKQHSKAARGEVSHPVHKVQVNVSVWNQNCSVDAFHLSN